MHLAVGGAGHGVECQRKAVFGVDWPQGAIQRRIGGVIAVRLFVVAVATNRLHFLLSCAHSDAELPFCLCGLEADAQFWESAHLRDVCRWVAGDTLDDRQKLICAVDGGSFGSPRRRSTTTLRDSFAAIAQGFAVAPLFHKQLLP